MRLSFVLDCADPDALVDFWAAALGYRPVASPPGYRVLVAAEGSPPGSPVLVLQRVPEPRTGKNRAHVDVHPPLDVGVAAHVARLESLGGRRDGPPVVDLLDSAGIWWQRMADPEGNALCVVADPGSPPPAPPTTG